VARIIGVILMIALFVVAIKVAIVVLIFAGLIFRTKETIGLLILLAGFAFVDNHPLIGSLALAALIAIGIMRAAQKKPEPSEVLITDDQE
jgi:hydrogenase/urease accessory protein HupE